MSNIAVVPCFQNPWVIMSALNYSGTATCPGILAKSAVTFLARQFPPPLWASSAMSTPPLAVYTSYGNTYPVLSPCTVLLLISGSYDIALEIRACSTRAPHYFAFSSCHARTRPPSWHDRACSIKKFLPQPLQVAGVF